MPQKEVKNIPENLSRTVVYAFLLIIEIGRVNINPNTKNTYAQL